MKMVNISSTKKSVNVFEYNNGWRYEFESFVKKTMSARTSYKTYAHTIINPAGQRFLLPNVSGKSIASVIYLAIYENIGYVYSTDEWKYSIKLGELSSKLGETKITHFLEWKGIVKQIPYVSTRLIDEHMIKEWVRFHCIEPVYTGNKTLCDSMIQTLKLTLKKYGKSDNCRILSEHDIKEIGLLLVIKKLLK